MKKRPVIGVCPAWNAADRQILLLASYADALILNGALPILPPIGDCLEEVLDDFLARCDGLLVTGGEDLEPAFYGAERHPACGPTVPERDQFDKLLFTRALEMDMPVLGICRGIQLINTVLGGTLYQDIPCEWDTDICHRMERPFDRVAHTVQVLPGTPLAELVKADSIEVNSIHHQCIKELAPGCEVMAKAPDGIIEAIWHPGYRYIRAVQWHPERLLNVTPESNAIFRDFVQACCPV